MLGLKSHDVNARFHCASDADRLHSKLHGTVILRRQLEW
jgi:hypothetical protein